MQSLDIEFTSEPECHHLPEYVKSDQNHWALQQIDLAKQKYLMMDEAHIMIILHLTQPKIIKAMNVYSLKILNLF